MGSMGSTGINALYPPLRFYFFKNIKNDKVRGTTHTTHTNLVVDPWKNTTSSS